MGEQAQGSKSFLHLQWEQKQRFSLAEISKSPQKHITRLHIHSVTVKLCKSRETPLCGLAEKWIWNRVFQLQVHKKQLSFPQIKPAADQIASLLDPSCNIQMKSFI